MLLHMDIDLRMDIGTDSWHCCMLWVRMKVLLGTCNLQHMLVFKTKPSKVYASRTVLQQDLKGTQLHLIVQNPSGITIWLQSDIGGSIEPLLQLAVLRVIASQAVSCIAV